MSDTHLLQSMLDKLLAKGIEVEAVVASKAWCGKVKKTRWISEETFEVTVEQNVDGAVIKTSYIVWHPDLWKLGKDDTGAWKLWAPREKTMSAR